MDQKAEQKQEEPHEPVNYSSILVGLIIIIVIVLTSYGYITPWFAITLVICIFSSIIITPLLFGVAIMSLFAFAGAYEVATQNTQTEKEHAIPTESK